MSDIFQEVDEDVRRDKAIEYWNKNQNKIIAVCAAIILATAGFRFYRYEREIAAQNAGAAFQQALTLDQDGKSKEAAAAFAAIATDAPSGYQTLARLAKAASLSAVDPKAALAAYDGIANDASVDPLLAQAAKLRAAMIRLDNGEADQGAKDLEALATAGAPYRNTAREALGALALKKGDFDAAGKWLDAVVSDADAPAPAKERAQTLLGFVASNAPGK